MLKKTCQITDIILVIRQTSNLVHTFLLLQKFWIHKACAKNINLLPALQQLNKCQPTCDNSATQKMEFSLVTEHVRDTLCGHDGQELWLLH